VRDVLPPNTKEEAAAVTITRYTLETFTGSRSNLDFDTYGEAASIAQRDGLLVIANHYEFTDSELVEDFTRWRWLVAAGVEDDPYWLPAGPDTCFDSPQDACDDLAARLTSTQEHLPGCAHPIDGQMCGTCRPCQVSQDLEQLIVALTDGEIDVEQRDLRYLLSIDPDAPVTYSISRTAAVGIDDAAQ
jgi:hypothetical protein